MLRVETRVESAWFQRSKLKYNKLLSIVAFRFNLRPYTEGQHLCLRVMSEWRTYTRLKQIGKSTVEMANRMLRKKRMESTLCAWKRRSRWEHSPEQHRLMHAVSSRRRRRAGQERFRAWQGGHSEQTIGRR